MTKRIKLICVIILSILFMSIFFFQYRQMNVVRVDIQAKASDYEITANFYADQYSDTITAYKNDLGEYYLFLPSFAKGKALSIDTPSSMNISSASALNLEKLTENIQEYEINNQKLTILIGSKLPVMFINTNKELSYLQESKENTANGQVMISSEDGKSLYNGKIDQIGGRGNTSWRYKKKPYNLVFSESVSLFGMHMSEKYSLIASSDRTLLRNRLSNELGTILNLPIINRISVDVYINGDYQGVYELCEKITPETMNIQDLEKATEDLNSQHEKPAQITTGEFADDWNQSVTGKWGDYPNTPNEITGGYILEADDAIRYSEEASGFITGTGVYIVSKSPAYLTKREYYYINSYITEIESIMKDSVNMDDYSALEEYIDIPSFVSKYLLEEVSKNVDSTTSSQYFYKDANGLLYAGPPWDYDWAYGVDRANEEINYLIPEGFSAKDVVGSLVWWQLLYYN